MVRSPKERVEGTSVLVSYRCCDKVPKIGWLKTRKAYCLTVLEAGSLNSSCGRALLSLMAPGRILPCLF